MLIRRSPSAGCVQPTFWHAGVVGEGGRACSARVVVNGVRDVLV